MNKAVNKITIATGGTGGHVFPAHSLAKHFIEKNINVEIISDKRGLRFLQKFKDIKITKIYTTTIFKKNILSSILSIFIIFFSIFKSLLLLLKDRPNLVFGMGGYSSFPICAAAKILRIPFIIYENNLLIGKANKYLLPYAAKIFVSYKDLEGVPAKYQKKVIQIGNIIRKEILSFENKNLDKKNKALNILVIGGSQAAKVFGEKLPQIFKECKKENIELKIYQQCLPQQMTHISDFYKDKNIEFEVFNFSNNILDYFSKADLVITRAGSSMLSELINANIPFISVPLPSSEDNHQLKNAIYYKKNKYSFLIEEKDLTKELFLLIKKISDNKLILDEMILKQKQYSDKMVYENIEKQIKDIFDEKH